MEPQLPTPREAAQLDTQNAEYVETRLEAPVDGARSAPELQTVSVQTTSVAQSAAQPMVLVSDPVSTSQASVTASANSDSPAIADDVDVIEKEWVDKAKKIVSATKDDPYNQEKQVSKLQADYLMKRYGKQIKTVE